MGEQLSLKAAMPLAEILATCRKNVSNTGPWTFGQSLATRLVITSSVSSAVVWNLLLYKLVIYGGLHML